MIDISQFSGRYAEIVNHYVRYLGLIPRQVFTYSGLANKNIPDPIYVLEFNPLNDDLENYDWIYVTVGASARPMSYPHNVSSTAGGHRIELMINSREANRQLADALSDLAAYPFVVNTWLGVGHTIMGTPGHGIVDGSPLTDIFLTIPHITEKGFRYIEHSDNTHSEILWVVPVYQSERLFAKQNGYQALENLFWEKEPDTSDLNRARVI